MTSKKQLQIFISHLAINQDVNNEFITKFKSHHSDCKVIDEQNTSDLDFSKQLNQYIKHSDIVVLLFNSDFLARITDTVRSVFKEKRIIFVPVLLQQCGFKEWNDPQDDNLLFFDSKRGNFIKTRLKGHDSENHNQKNIAYQEVHKDDKEDFHLQLKNWIAEKYKERTAINNEEKTAINDKKSNDEKHKILKDMLSANAVSKLTLMMEEELRKEDTLLWQKLAIKSPSLKVSFAYWYSQRLIEKLDGIDRKIAYCKSVSKIQDEFNKLVPIVAIFQTIYGYNYDERNPILVSTVAMSSIIEESHSHELNSLKSIASCRIIELTRSLEKIKKEALLWK